jgi:RecB family exonuclease
MFKGCPRRYKARYIEKIFTFTTNKFIERGNALHEYMATRINAGQDHWPEGESLNVRANCDRFLQAFHLDQLREKGWLVTAEAKMSVDSNYGLCDYWDDKAYLRGIIDLLMVPPDPNKGPILIVDWKTGKTPGSPEQLIANALTLSASYGERPYTGFFCYLDSGKIETFKFNTYRGRQDPRIEAVVQNLLAVHKAYGQDEFPPKPGGKDCRWCEIQAHCSHELGGAR